MRWNKYLFNCTTHTLAVAGVFCPHDNILFCFLIISICPSFLSTGISPCLHGTSDLLSFLWMWLRMCELNWYAWMSHSGCKFAEECQRGGGDKKVSLENSPAVLLCLPDALFHSYMTSVNTSNSIYLWLLFPKFAWLQAAGIFSPHFNFSECCILLIIPSS